MAKGLCFGLLAAAFTPGQLPAQPLNSPGRSMAAQESTSVPSTSIAKPAAPHRSKRANFEREHPSLAARHVADWVVDSGDNLSLPFVIVDKSEARVFVFYADGRLRGASRALLGQAKGDEGVPGIGDRKMSSIRPEERTTPAGRFVASLGRNMRGIEILWVDYKAAISMHRVVTNKPKERRLQRLATQTPLDKRISYGCINVPAKFFDKVVRTAFTRTNGIVYVLPEIKSASEVFGSYDVEEHTRLLNLTLPVSTQLIPLAGLP